MNDIELGHLRRCVELATEALDAGDEPFGSVLAAADGTFLAEDRNRIAGGDNTRHPRVRAGSVGGSVPDAGRAFDGNGIHLGRALRDVFGRARVGGPRTYRLHLLFGSTRRLARGVGCVPAPVKSLSVNEVAPNVPVEGPVPELVPLVRELHRKLHSPSA